MWKINNLANKAAEAIQTAKKGIEVIAKEIPAKKDDSQGEILMKQCSKYREQVIKLQENNESLIKEVGILKNQQGFINFKIFIGRLEPDDLQYESQAEKFKVMGEDLDQRLKEKSLECENHMKQLEKIKMKAAQSDENLAICRKNEENLKTKLKEADNHLTRVLLKSQKAEKELFLTLKKNFELIGLSMSSIKVEDLGLEDIQEFFLTQTRYFENCFKELQDVCKEIGKNPKTLDDFRIILSDSIKNYEKTAKVCEENLKVLQSENEKLIKEKEDANKLNKKLTERVKILFEEVKKSAENSKLLEKLKEDANLSQKKSEEQNKKLEKMYNENLFLKEKISGIENNNKNLEDQYIKIEEYSENLKKRLKNLNSELIFKENLLKEQEIQIKTLKNDLENLKKSFDIEIAQIKTKNIIELKDSQESNLLLHEEISNRLKETQNKLGCLIVENSQLTIKAKKLDEIEENYGILGNQNSKNQEKIEELLKENEKNWQKFKKIQEKYRNLKNLTEVLNKKLKDSYLENDKTLKKLEEFEELKNSLTNQNDFFLEQVKSTQELLSGMIDKRMISTFLINFLNDKNSANAKKQMLRAMSEVLEMPSDQKERLISQVDNSFMSQVKSYLAWSN